MPIEKIFDGVRCMKAGHYHSALIDSKGRVYTWGWGIHGQLGHGGLYRSEDVLIPKLVETIRCGCFLNGNKDFFFC